MKRRRPNTVYVAVVLWVVAAGLTALIAAIGLLTVIERSRSVEWSSVLVAALVLVGFGVVSIVQLHRGQPVARVALAGVAVYFTFGLLLDLMVIGASSADIPETVIILEAVRTACAIAGTLASFTRTAGEYFYDADAEPSQATALPGWLWAFGITMLAAQFAVNLWDNLPDMERSLARWAGTRRAAAALQASMGLCLIPAYFALVRQFRFGRQWSRVTLTVLGVLCGVLAVVGIVDVLEARNPQDVAVIVAVLAAAQLASLLAAIVTSYRPAVNADFREARLTR